MLRGGPTSSQLFRRVFDDRPARSSLLHVGFKYKILQPKRRCFERRYAVQSSPPSAPQPVVTTKRSFGRRIFLSDRHYIIRWIGRGIFAIGFSIISITGGLLLWDATTYRTKHLENVPINPLALTPERGGPKNLKIAKFLIGDEETEDVKLLVAKPKLVVLGGGWGVSVYENAALTLTEIGTTPFCLDIGLGCWSAEAYSTRSVSRNCSQRI